MNTRTTLLLFLAVYAFAACDKEGPTKPEIPYIIDYRDSLTGYWTDTAYIKRLNKAGEIIEERQVPDSLVVRKVGADSIEVMSKLMRFKVQVFRPNIIISFFYHYNYTRNDTVVKGHIRYHGREPFKRADFVQRWTYGQPNDETYIVGGYAYFYRPLQ